MKKNDMDARSRRLRAAFATAGAAALLAGWPTASRAQATWDLRPGAVMVQAGASDDDAATASVGLVWPWSLRRPLWGGELTGSTEAYVSTWRADSWSGGSRHYTQANLVPMLRLRFAQGRSPWFAEAGIGASLLDMRLRTPDKEFSTRFNFADVVGIGRNIGADQRQELGLRFVHYSNAGIKKPNPGIDFLQLRYAVAF